MCAAPAPGPESSDAQLIERIAGGDRQALASLYDRYAASLLGAGMYTLKQRRDAEDVLHDVFVEVWQQAGDYDPIRGSVKAWLFLRMRSRAIDRVRLVGAKAALEDAMIDSMPAQETEDVTLAPDRRLVRRALSDLPAEQRIALELAYFGGLSGSQIAARLGAPLGTIKTRLALGMSKLRAAFDVRGDE
jgi:RNA polymerase sigma-70 factor (ECF subfamily)